MLASDQKQNSSSSRPIKLLLMMMMMMTLWISLSAAYIDCYKHGVLDVRDSEQKLVATVADDS